MSAAPAAVARTPTQVLHLYRRCLRSAMRIRDGDHRSTYVQYVREGFRRHMNERIDSYRSMRAADFAQEQVERMDYFHSIVRERDGGRGMYEAAAAAEEGDGPLRLLDRRAGGDIEGEHGVGGSDRDDDVKSRADVAASPITALPPRAEVQDEKRSTDGRRAESSPDLTSSTIMSFVDVADDRGSDKGSGSNDAGSEGLVNREQQDDGEEAVSEWIAAAVPELREDDVRSYARQLVDDGFDSVGMLEREDVVDAGIMTEDDLSFMKKAHRRALLSFLERRKGGKGCPDTE